MTEKLLKLNKSLQILEDKMSNQLYHLEIRVFTANLDSSGDQFHTFASKGKVRSFQELPSFLSLLTSVSFFPQ